MPIQSDGPAPYTAPKAVIDLIEAYRGRGLQTPFTQDVLIKAGVSETLAPRTFTALKLLGLIEDSGEPTQQFVDLRKAPEDEFKDRFAAIIRGAYAEVFSYVDPAMDPIARVRDAFRSYTPIGQQPRMVTLFLGLSEYAGIIPPDPERKAKSAAGAATRGPRAQRSNTRQRSGGTLEPRTPDTVPVGATLPLDTLFPPKNQPVAAGGHPLIQGLLRELPPVGATWPESKLKTWLETQRAVFNLLYKIEQREAPISSARGSDPD
ncbi:MAG: DUF5343 domain-containing protein [Gaiellaceae bacterium]